MREYKTRITSISGKISGELIHGIETNLTSFHGAIDVVLLPYNVYEKHYSEIQTKSYGNNTKVQVLEPVKDYDYTDPVMNKTKSWHEVGMRGPASLWL